MVISAESLSITLAGALIVSGCSSEDSFIEKCKEHGKVEVFHELNWRMAKKELEEELSSNLPFPGGLQTFSTPNFTVTPIREINDNGKPVLEDELAFVVSRKEGLHKQVAIIHGFSKTTSATRIADDRAQVSCFAVKKWVQEL
ncbi:hypothetical protein [Parasphingorhabdus sp.]|uniref:hypothetical protein n=1 Tax=Parasphingorhabdus sp. TaxID=2709688 RepID=UPI00300137E7